MPPRKKPDLSALVAEMRRLGILEFQDGDLRVKLSATPPITASEASAAVVQPEMSPERERAVVLGVPRFRPEKAE